MASSNRPVAVLVMAVLNFVFGGFGILAGGCCGCVLLTLPAIADKIPKDPPNIAFDVFLELPGYRNYVVGSLAVGFLLALVLVISGFGLLGMRPWARTTCIIYAFLYLLVQMGELAATYGYFNPMIKDWQAAWFERHPQAPKIPENSWLGDIPTFLLIAFGVAYAIALLIVMFLPTVTAAFAGRTQGSTPEVEDYYDTRPDDDGGFAR